MNGCRHLSLAMAGLALGACGWADAPGKRIYQDGIGAQGPIAYTQGPDWLRFTSPSCAVCHGQRGQGLSMQAGGVTGIAPPVNWRTLEERGYDEASLRIALTDGIDPQGREFDYYMPRWSLDETDMDALVTYLRTL